MTSFMFGDLDGLPTPTLTAARRVLSHESPRCLHVAARNALAPAVDDGWRCPDPVPLSLLIHRLLHVVRGITPVKSPPLKEQSAQKRACVERSGE
jgi:hypothetical protein